MKQDIVCFMLTGVLDGDVVYQSCRMTKDGDTEDIAMFPVKTVIDLGDRVVEATTKVLVRSGDGLEYLRERSPERGECVVLNSATVYPNADGQLCCRVNDAKQITFPPNGVSMKQDISCFMLAGTLLGEVEKRTCKMTKDGDTEDIAMFSMTSTSDLGDKVLTPTTNVLVRASALESLGQVEHHEGQSVIIYGIAVYPSANGTLCCRVDDVRQIKFLSGDVEYDVEGFPKEAYMTADDFFIANGCVVDGEGANN